jgi:hypothetical protein
LKAFAHPLVDVAIHLIAQKAASRYAKIFAASTQQ